MGDRRTAAGWALLLGASGVWALGGRWVEPGPRWSLVALGGVGAVLCLWPRTAGRSTLRVHEAPEVGSWFAAGPGRPALRPVAAKLASAGDQTPAPRALGRVAAVAVLAAAVGGVVAGPAGAAVGAATVAVAWWGRLSARAGRRRRRFDDQLPEILQMLSSSLRAGHGLAASLESVAAEAVPPAAEELARAVAEVRLGKDVVEALGEAARRCGSEDLGWVVDAMAVQRELGGELAPLVDNVAGTVRDRQSVRRQVKALSAEGRLSAAVLFVIPIALVVVLQVMNPGYLATLTGSGTGRVMLVVGGALMVVGALWMRAIVKVRF